VQKLFVGSKHLKQCETATTSQRDKGELPGVIATHRTGRVGRVPEPTAACMVRILTLMQFRVRVAVQASLLCFPVMLASYIDDPRACEFLGQDLLLPAAIDHFVRHTGNLCPIDWFVNRVGGQLSSAISIRRLPCKRGEIKV
jgi:hypothetical protein